ncbi:MAG: N-acetylmuramoyl-L-alanine amidase [Proteobacteria bacterium]|nr:N-acetylmuramoyl-L-alanine amidase [Pseudomonadota bacterium]
MPLKKYQISLIFIILAIFVLTGAKPAKRAKKVESPFERLKREYITYKHTESEFKESKLKEFYSKFQQISENGGDKDKLPAQYFCADVMEKLFEVTGSEHYLEKAIDIYKKISLNNNSFGIAARKKIELYGGYKKNKTANTVENNQSLKNTDLQSTFIKLLSVKQESSDNYTRVILELSNNATYEHKFLREDPEANKPKRIVVDIQNAILGDGISQNIPVSDKFVDKIRIGQFTKDIARIVIDIVRLESYKVYVIDNPTRIVIDIYGEEIKKSIKNEINNANLAINSKNYNLTVSKIVLDPGHGGHDPGAIGYNGLKEKDVVLDIALKVGNLIKNYFPEIEVIYTRDDDYYLALDERTKIANSKKADLFVSIHANASKNKVARGIETYFLDFTKEERAKEVAARENATTLQGVDEVQAILRDLIVSSKYNESTLLASLIQKSLVDTLSNVNGEINNLGVKQGPFYVLIGAAMPSVLVETSFITNEKEGSLLATNDYRNYIAKGIFDGIKDYIMKTATVKDNGERKIVAR